MASYTFYLHYTKEMLMMDVMHSLQKGITKHSSTTPSTPLQFIDHMADYISMQKFANLSDPHLVANAFLFVFFFHCLKHEKLERHRQTMYCLNIPDLSSDHVIAEKLIEQTVEFHEFTAKVNAIMARTMYRWVLSSHQ